MERIVRDAPFSTALEYLRTGRVIARAGWNGKGMWLLLVKPGSNTLNPAVHYDVIDDAFDPSLGQTSVLAGVELAPWIGMKTADNKFVPWLASQTDLLASDWEGFDNV